MPKESTIETKPDNKKAGTISKAGMKLNIDKK